MLCTGGVDDERGDAEAAHERTLADIGVLDARARDGHDTSEDDAGANLDGGAGEFVARGAVPEWRVKISPKDHEADEHEHKNGNDQSPEKSNIAE